MPAVPSGAACFGKLPTHGDFVRYCAGGRAMQTFDAWVQQGVAQAKPRASTDLETTGATHCFFADVPGAPHALAGALRPSRDRTGRRYPFLVAVEVEKQRVEGRRIPSWPARYRAFYDAAAALVDDAVADRLAEGELAERLHTLGAIYDATPFPVDYEYRLRQAPARALWTQTWGDPEDGRKYVVLKNLTETFDRLRNGRTIRLQTALQLPLPRAHDGLAASFWLEACWQLLGATPDQPVAFWTASEARSEVGSGVESGEGGSLLVASAPPPRGLFAHLSLDQPGAGVLALDDAGDQSAALAALALPPRYGTLLEEDALTLHGFIRRVGT